MQGVVFNAHYMTYVDDVIDQWLTHAIGAGYLHTFEYAVKKVSIEWFSSATAGDVIEAVPTIARWGRTSFEVSVGLHVESRAVAEAQVVAVAVAPGTHEPTPVSERVRAALGEASG